MRQLCIPVVKYGLFKKALGAIRGQRIQYSCILQGLMLSIVNFRGCPSTRYILLTNQLDTRGVLYFAIFGIAVWLLNA